MSTRAQHGCVTHRPRHPGRLGVFAFINLIGLSLWSLTGCAHYQLGTASRLAFATLYVAPVGNHAMLPQAQTVFATEIRDALLKDGRVSLVATPETADAVLRVSLVGYDRQMAAANPADTGLARKFVLNLHALCTLTDRRTGKPLFVNREIQASRDAYTDSGQLQAEYQTLPLLAATLADKVTHAVLDVW
jgi:Lipopolysaccharide-assembly